MKTGIYTITNIVNGKLYLGCTIDFSKRKHDHLKKLRTNSHKNKHLQDSFNKYGEQNFRFEILVECTKEMLASEEHYWSNLLKIHDRKFGYNQRPTHPYNKIVQTPETIEKMRNSLKGRKLSEESIRKRTETRKKNGYKHSEETRKKIGRKGRKMSDEAKAKMISKLKGRVLSEEHIRKAVEGRKGYKHSEETKNKIRDGRRKKNEL